MIFQVTKAACVYHDFFSATECEVLDMEIDVFPGTELINDIIILLSFFFLNLSNSFKMFEIYQLSTPT